jgi:hypothetical protein
MVLIFMFYFVRLLNKINFLCAASNFPVILDGKFARVYTITCVFCLTYYSDVVRYSLPYAFQWLSQVLLLKPIVHYRVHKSLPLKHSPSHMSPVQSLASCISNIYFNIILLSISVDLPNVFFSSH